MKQRHEPAVEELLERYFNSESTPADEERLRAWARECPEREEPADEAARIMLAGFAGLAAERMPERRTTPVVPLRRGARGRLLAVCAAVAAAVLVVLSVRNRPYCYIDGVPVYDREEALQAWAYLQPLERFGSTVEMFDRIIVVPETDH